MNDQTNPKRPTERARLWLERIRAFNPDDAADLDELPEAMAAMASLSGDEAIIIYTGWISRIGKYLGLADDSETLPDVSLSAENDLITFSLPCDIGGTDPLVAASEMIHQAGAAKRMPSPTEYACLFAAGQRLRLGRTFPGPAVPWRAPGFRPHQTKMSITDPGTGHLHGTCLADENLDGVIVHIEHLERGIAIPRNEIEPYRIPMPAIVPRVCLWTASRAPVSTYVGRPAFDGEFDQSMFKTVHTMAAACNDFFANGVTECKTAVENMTASQAISFLRALAGNLRRDRTVQILSAAFCLNVPILDDLGQGPARLVTDQVEIGLLGIRIAYEAGIEKGTWDGTADTYPSNRIIEQLGYEAALTLVHHAHEKGLLTYFSAGFRYDQIVTAVHCGVDGIGIGGAQILRFMDYTNGNHGPFKTGNIRRILEARNLAESQPLVKAAKLLARLDQMAFEGSVTSDLDRLRRELFATMKARDEQAIAKLRTMLHATESLPDDSIRAPALSSARRVFESWHLRSEPTEIAVDPNIDHIAPQMLKQAIDTSNAALAASIMQRHQMAHNIR